MVQIYGDFSAIPSLFWPLIEIVPFVKHWISIDERKAFNREIGVIFVIVSMFLAIGNSSRRRDRDISEHLWRSIGFFFFSEIKKERTKQQNNRERFASLPNDRSTRSRCRRREKLFTRWKQGEVHSFRAFHSMLLLVSLDIDKLSVNVAVYDVDGIDNEEFGKMFDEMFRCTEHRASD